MPEPMSLTILRASAGSGKTYALTLNYLQLLLKQGSPSYFRSILAVTFTNKATKEMKERILSELEKLAAGETDKGMGLGLLEVLQIEAAELQQRAKAALVDILHNYSHFSVSTIDSFFQKIVRNFAREADLPATYKIEMNTARILEELTDQLMDKAEKDQQLQNWLIRFSSQQLSEGKSWDVRKNLHKLIGEVVKEGFMEQADELLQLSKSPEIAQGFLDKSWHIKRAFEGQMREWGQAGMKAIEDSGLGVEDFSYGKGGAANYFNRMLLGSDYEPKSRVLKTLSGDMKWYTGKLAKEKVAIIEGMADTVLAPLMQQARDLYEEGFGDYLSACIVLEHFTSCALLGQYMQLLEKYRQDNNILLISDVAELLHAIIGEADAPFVYEKTGNRYAHFLIDEFQDTSRLHWHNFLPLIENSVAFGNKNLIVGDPKQSIYRWRGGDLRLMLQEVGQALPGARNEQLMHNWRSCPAVIDFNNRCFEAAAEAVAVEAEEKLGGREFPALEQQIVSGLLDNITAVYENARQLFPEAKKKAGGREGYVKVQFLRDQKRGKEAIGLNFKELARVLLLDNIREVRAKGYPLQDIALLVRSNGDARALAIFLSEAGIDVLSEDALQLNAASSVQLMVNLLHYLHNFKNKPALAAAIKLYADTRHLAGDFSPVSLEQSNVMELGELAGLLPDAFIKGHISLSRMPLYDLSRRLARMFELEKLQGEEHYLEAFLNEIHRYSHEEKGDLGGFLQWWAEEGLRQNLKREEAPEAIRIITIHKSKGLQYPVVIVPYCNWKLDVDTQGKTNIIWAGIRRLEDGSMRLPLFDGLPLSKIPLTYSSKLSDSCFGFDHLQEMYQAFLDNLNLLYVALTRAEEALIISAEESKGDSRHMGWVLQESLKGTEREEISATVDEKEFSFSQISYGSLQQSGSSPAPAAPPEGQVSEPLQNWDQLLRLRRHAKPLQIGKSENIAARVDYGTMVHDMLSRVRQVNSLPNILGGMQLRGDISGKDAAVLKRKMEGLMEEPIVASWFSDDWEVLNEQSILCEDGSIHRPDRVLLKDKRAIVIDYKTGERKSSHKTQLRRYMTQLSRMGYEQVEAYLLYLEEKDPVEQVLAV